jgi:hypothetical protein
MSTENESQSIESRSHRDEADDTVLNSRELELELDSGGFGRPDSRHPCVLLIMGVDNSEPEEFR